MSYQSYYAMCPWPQLFEFLHAPCPSNSREFMVGGKRDEKNITIRRLYPPNSTVWKSRFEKQDASDAEFAHMRTVHVGDFSIVSYHASPIDPFARWQLPKSWSVAEASAKHQLVFDIDELAEDFKDGCRSPLNELQTMQIKFLQAKALRLACKQVLDCDAVICFSGNRGFHIWTRHAMALSDAREAWCRRVREACTSAAVIAELSDEVVHLTNMLQFDHPSSTELLLKPKLDEAVTVMTSHMIRVPFTLSDKRPVPHLVVPVSPLLKATELKMHHLLVPLFLRKETSHEQSLARLQRVIDQRIDELRAIHN